MFTAACFGLLFVCWQILGTVLTKSQSSNIKLVETCKTNTVYCSCFLKLRANQTTQKADFSEIVILFPTHFFALQVIWNGSVDGYGVYFDLGEYIRVQTGFHHQLTLTYILHGKEQYQVFPHMQIYCFFLGALLNYELTSWLLKFIFCALFHNHCNFLQNALFELFEFPSHEPLFCWITISVSAHLDSALLSATHEVDILVKSV